MLAAKPKCLFWIYGNLRDCKKQWETLCKVVRDKIGQDLNIETVYCGFNSKATLPEHRLASVENLIYQLRSKDLFSNNPRIIRVIGIPENYNNLISYLNLVSTKNILVFWGPPGYYSSSKRWNSIKISNLYKTVKKDGKIYEFPVVAKDRSEATRWLKAVCEDMNVKIELESIKSIVDLEGLNLDILDNVIQKLAIYSARKKIVTTDVEECCRTNFQKEVWSYLRHLDTGQYDEAMVFLQGFYEVSPNPGESFYGRVNKLFGAIKQHFLFLMAAKDACPQYLKAKDIEQSLRTFKKSTPTEIQKVIDGELSADDLSPIFSSGYIYKQLNSDAMRKAFSWKKSRIYQILADVYVCMFLCRYRSGDDFYIKLCLDTFTMQVCGKISSKQATLIRGNKRKYKLYNVA